MSIITEWSIRTVTLRVRSPSLKALDGAVQVLATQGTGVRDANAVDAFQKLKAWKAASPLEYAKISAQADELKTAVVDGYNRRAVPLAGVTATQIGPVGYRLYAPGDANYEQDGDAMLPLNQRLPDLTPVEIRRLNEAVARVLKAVSAARDAMIKIASKKSLAPPLAAAEALYVDYFGAYDPARAQTVLKNFKTLHTVASGNGPIIFDHRNTDFGEDCYAACKRGTVVNDLKIWMGRDFFAEGKAGGSAAVWNALSGTQSVYNRTTDATLGTLVHEMSHGSFRAVDAPKVDAGGNWELAPDAATWASPDNDEQSSTPELDKRLAKKEPRAAIVNADNYGQFAVEVMKLQP
jgi:hypothetical protein